MKNNIFKIATFNVCNLVLPEVKFYGDTVYSKDEYNKKINWIGHQLRLMNADIVGFQEVFHGEALEEAIRASGIYKPDVNIITANPTGEKPTVGLLSRYPVISKEVVEIFPPQSLLDVEKEDTLEKIVLPYNKFSRPVLRVRLKIKDNLEMTVYVIHLKSKRPLVPEGVDKNDPIESSKGKARALILRAAEATALRVLLLDDLLHKEYPVVVLGDVNDTGLSVTSRIVSSEPPHRKYPQDVKNKIWDILLYQVQDIQARQSYRGFYHTHIHNGYYEALDHIMVSQELVRENPRNIGRVVYVTTLTDHLIDETLSDERIEKWQSDHGQVVATIELRSQNQKRESS
jgi:predicted extracellular nuclease